MIRELTVDEIPLCVEGGKSFFDEGKLPGGFKPEIFIACWQRLIRNGIGVILGLFNESGEIQGALGAVIYPDMNNGDITAVENFWYMLPQCRGQGLKLLKEYEKWARRRGAKRLAMIHLLNLQPEKLGALYQRLGFEPIETNYIKVLADGQIASLDETGDNR